jgi:hypothetical protein
VGLGTAGSLAGGAAGAFYGFTGFSRDAAQELEKQMFDLNRAKDLQAEIVFELRERVPTEMLSKPELADMQAILAIENIEFVRQKDVVYIETFVRLTFSTNESRRRPETGSAVFHGRSHQDNLNAWLNADSDDLAVAVNESFVEVAEKIAIVLKEHWRPTTQLR